MSNNVDPKVLARMQKTVSFFQSQQRGARRIKLEKGHNIIVRFLPARLGPDNAWYALIAKHWLNRVPITCPRLTGDDFGGDIEADCPVCTLAQELNDDADKDTSDFGWRMSANAAVLTYCVLWEKDGVKMPMDEVIKPYEFNLTKSTWEELYGFFMAGQRKCPNSVLDYKRGNDFSVIRTNKGYRLDKLDSMPIFNEDDKNWDNHIKKLEAAMKNPKVQMPTPAQLEAFADKVQEEAIRLHRVSGGRGRDDDDSPRGRSRSRDDDRGRDDRGRDDRSRDDDSPRGHSRGDDDRRLARDDDDDDRGRSRDRESEDRGREDETGSASRRRTEERGSSRRESETDADRNRDRERSRRDAPEDRRRSAPAADDDDDNDGDLGPVKDRDRDPEEGRTRERDRDPEEGRTRDREEDRGRSRERDPEESNSRERDDDPEAASDSPRDEDPQDHAPARGGKLPPTENRSRAAAGSDAPQRGEDADPDDTLPPDDKDRVPPADRLPARGKGGDDDAPPPDVERKGSKTQDAINRRAGGAANIQDRLNKLKPRE